MSDFILSGLYLNKPRPLLSKYCLDLFMYLSLKRSTPDIRTENK